MAELIIFPVECLIERNFEFTGIPCDTARRVGVAACYSSFYYYARPRLQIASIVMSLVKGHFFVDGNKRTALFSYLLLAQLNNLKYIEDAVEQAETFIKLAALNEDMEQAARMLFPEAGP